MLGRGALEGRQQLQHQFLAGVGDLHDDGSPVHLGCPPQDQLPLLQPVHDPANPTPAKAGGGQLDQPQLAFGARGQPCQDFTGSDGKARARR